MKKKVERVMFAMAFTTFMVLPAVSLADDTMATVGSSEQSVVLDEVVVSGTVTDAKLLDTPGTVNIFTAQDIEKGGYTSVGDILKTLPGIIEDTTNPATPKFNFRGTAYAHSRGATVYVDGKEINIGRIGYGDLSFVDLNDIEQIQVIKTPGAQYSEPSRGIIYITTKKGKTNGHQQRVQATYGSWGLHTENVSASGKTDSTDYRISAMNQGGEGYRRTEDERMGINAKAGYSFDETTRLGIGGGFQDQSYLSNTSLKKWQWDRDPRDNTPPNDVDNPTYNLSPYENDVQIFDVFTDFNMDKERWFAKSMLSFVNNETEYLSVKNQNNPSYADGNDTSSYLRDYDEDRLTFKASSGCKLTKGMTRNTLTFGVEYDDHDYDQIRTYPFLNVPGSTEEENMQKYDLDISIDRLSFIVNNDLKMGEHAALQTGVRYDDVALTLENMYPDDPDVDNDYKKVSWNISPGYTFTGRDNLYVTVSQSYFYPNIDYTRMSANYNHPENEPGSLKPEDIMSYEVGFKHQLNRMLNYSLAAFHMVVDDKFIFQYRYDEIEESWESLGACNLGRAVHQGIEVELDGWLTDWMNYRLNYGYLHAEWDDPDVSYRSYVWEADPNADYREEMSIDGKTVARTPEHKVTAVLSVYPVPDLLLWLNMTYVDDQYVDYMERVVQPSVTTFDFKLAYTFKKVFKMNRITVHGLVKNLTDENYAYYSNSTGVRNDDGTLDTNYYVYPGRYYEVGATVDF